MRREINIQSKVYKKRHEENALTDSSAKIQDFI